MMTALNSWSRRPREEAYLFNPAFLSSMIFEFVKEYQKSRPEGAPITFLPVALALTLHGPTRRKLPYSTVTSMYEWLQNNEEVLVDLSERLGGISRYAKEAVMFALLQETLVFADGHSLVLGDRKAHFSGPFLRETTPEISEEITRIKFFARWFAKSGSEASVLASWGVKP